MRTLAPVLIFASFLVSGVVAPQTARAGGLFYAGSGTRPLGRGAAYLVRADDPLALSYNPAALADLEGMQFLANFNVALLDACVDPAGTVDRGVPTAVIAAEPNGTAAGTVRDRSTYKENYAPSATPNADVTRFGVVPRGGPASQRKSWIGTTMPKVCNKTSVLPIPNFVFTYQFVKPTNHWSRPGLRGLTVAFGMVAPGAVAKTTWGNPDGTVRAKGHATQKQVDAAAPMSGVGKPLPAGIRPDAVCDPATDPKGCNQYCNPEIDSSCAVGKQYFCDPSKYDCDKLPTPTRYLLVQQDPFAIPITLGVGYRPTPWLAVGGAFTYQAVVFKSTVFATQTTTSIPELDMKIENELNDWFVPIASGSVKATPFTGLEFMGYFKWQDKIGGPTKATITDGAYTVGGAQGRLPVTSVIKAGDGLVTEVPQPWEAGGGVRFALPRGGFRGDYFQQPLMRQDAMTSEVFDIEFDFVLEHNSSIKEFSLKSKENAFKVWQAYDGDDTKFNGKTAPSDPNCSTVAGAPPTAVTRCTSDLRFLKDMSIKRYWKDQFVYRVGGDYNVIPGVLALRAGWNLETRGVSPAYQTVDAFPSRRMGIHGGLTWRIGRIDLSVAYGHLFQENIYALNQDATDPTGKRPSKDRADLQASSPDPNTRVVNAGSYRVSWDIISLGMNQRF